MVLFYAFGAMLLTKLEGAISAYSFYVYAKLAPSVSMQKIDTKESLCK